MLKYDVIVIGSSPADALATLELTKNNKKLPYLIKQGFRAINVWWCLVYRGKKLLDFNIDSVIERELKSINLSST
ncbi:MAG: hypothetical protein QM486_11405 [Flavobacteriaceae bacterium]